MGFAFAPKNAPKKNLTSGTNGHNFASELNLSPLEEFGKVKPFKKARLNDKKGDLSKRWVVEYSVWNERENRLKRRRWYKEFHKYKTVAARRAYGKQLVKNINKLLASGYYEKMDAPEPLDLSFELPVASTTIEDAFEYVLKLKEKEVAKGSYKKIRQVRDSFFKFFDPKEKPYPKDYSSKDIIAYSDFLITVDEKSTKTRNDNISWLSHIFGLFKEREWITENPAAGLKKLKVTTSTKNKAFSKLQVKAILEKADPQLELSILFFYYCFMRRNEIRLIKLSHLNLKEGQIYIPAEVAKSRKDSYIILPPPLIRKLKALELEKYPVDYYLLGNHRDLKREVIPSEKPFSENIMYERHKKILKELDLWGKDYTLYSWKHTGVVSAYKARIDIKSIQLQCRHYSLEQTDIYLKSLGLYKDRDVFDLMPEL